MSVNVMLAGVGFFPHTVAGDKNFWIRLSPLLKARGANLTALSVNDRTGVTEMPAGFKLHNLRRSFHLGNPDRFYSSPTGPADYKHKHHRAIDSLELLLTAARNLRAIRSIVRSDKIHVIHFMDNMGPAMRFLKSRLPGVRLTNSQVRFGSGRGYGSYIRASMLGLDRTVAYTEASRDLLVKVGIPADQIEVIRWGVRPADEPPDAEAVRSTRGKLGVTEGESLILWSGFIMHIQAPEFRAAAGAAHRIAAARPDCRFLFALKPLCYRPEFKSLEAERVSVVGDLNDFQAALAAADFFFSPAVDPNVNVSPPLTWLEAMNYGVPVIATQGSGVDEVIEDGRSGYVASSIETVAQAVNAALDAPDRDAVRRSCREVVRNRFDINASAEQYVRLWASLRG